MRMTSITRRRKIAVSLLTSNNHHNHHLQSIININIHNNRNNTPPWLWQISRVARSHQCCSTIRALVRTASCRSIIIILHSWKRMPPSTARPQPTHNMASSSSLVVASLHERVARIMGTTYSSHSRRCLSILATLVAINSSNSSRSIRDRGRA